MFVPGPIQLEVLLKTNLLFPYIFPTNKKQILDENMDNLPILPILFI